MASDSEKPSTGPGESTEPACTAPAADRLDTTDLDDEDLKVLSEVSKKGYYHGRPKNEATESVPQRIDASRPEVVSAAAAPQKRTEFDDYQRKWDKVDRELREEDTEATEATEATGTSSRTRIAPPSQSQPPTADEAVVEQLVAMGFGVEESRAAAIATRNRSEAAVEYLLAGGGQGQAPAPAHVPAPTPSRPNTNTNTNTTTNTADPAHVAALTEMGVPERLARQALKRCANNLERAVDLATGGMEDESAVALREVGRSIAQLESEMTALRTDCGAAPSVLRKRLRGLSESVTQTSCRLDTIDVEGDNELREQRRVELGRCGELERELAGLQESLPAGSSTAAPAPATTEAPSPTQAQTSAQECISEAESLRLNGNEAFKTGDYGAAAKHYEAALELDRENVAILSNLAAAELKLERFAAAAAHAGAANDLSGGFSAKALFRKGQALEGLGQLAEACAAFKAAWEVEPRDRLLEQRLKECRQRLAESTS